jgi:O-antigen/teichoic acid export membrane protein
MNNNILVKQRKIRLAKNTISSFIGQISAIVSGFIIPRLILQAYGSDVNGLVNSIKQFLGIISFLDLGVGAVVQSSLYEPLAYHNNDLISKIYKSASKFFHTIGTILLIYVIFLVVFYPRFANQDFGYIYTALLIVAISISYFAQYYFGIVNELLLTADQHGYIQSIASTITIIINTIASYVLIFLGGSIQIVMFASSLAYLIRPFILNYYVKKHYVINKKIKYEIEPIQQKWSGIAQHVSAVVLDNTDIIVLTVMSTMANVSIYYVYHLVVNGLKTLFFSLTNGIQSLLGELLARKDYKELEKTFDWTEWIIHTVTTLCFGCTGILIVPFVRVYTNGINDANYIVPVFATCITLANAGHCLRLPYHIMIKAAGRYHETQNNFIIATTMNIVISVVMVHRFGLVGVAIGTMVAMIYQSVWMAFYNSNHIMKWPISNFFKHIAVDVATVVMGSLLTFRIPLIQVSYWAWIILAAEVFAIWTGIVIAINSLIYPDKIKRVANKILMKARKS